MWQWVVYDCLLIFHMLIYCIKHNMTWQNVMNPLPSVFLSTKCCKVVKLARWSEGEAGRSGPSPRKSLARITNVHTSIFCFQQYVCTFYFWMEGWPRTVHLLITSLPHRHLLHKPSLCCRVKCQILNPSYICAFAAHASGKQQYTWTAIIIFMSNLTYCWF